MFPDSEWKVNFSSTCTVATNWYDGTNGTPRCLAPATAKSSRKGARCHGYRIIQTVNRPVGLRPLACDAWITCNWSWGAASYTNVPFPTMGPSPPKPAADPCANGKYYNANDCRDPGKSETLLRGRRHWRRRRQLHRFLECLLDNLHLRHQDQQDDTPVTTYTTNRTVITNITTRPVDSNHDEFDRHDDHRIQC